MILTKDIRDAFFNEIYKLGKKDKDLIVVTNDMDVFGLRKFRDECPKQFINAGVAEQNMIDVSAGLAATGKRVLVYGMVPFVTFRCYEQIKFSICSMKLPVVIVGVGCGLSFSFDGPSVHGTHDLSVMRMLPEMSIFNPCDEISSFYCARLAQSHSPAYVRMDKGSMKAIYGTHKEVSSGFKIIRPISDINIISTGYMTHKAIEVADILDIGVIDICRIKPFNENVLDLISGTKYAVSLEENSVVGGLGGLMAELLDDSDIKLTRIGLPPNEQYMQYGTREWLHSLYGLTVEKIAKKIERYAKQ